MELTLISLLTPCGG